MALGSWMYFLGSLWLSVVSQGPDDREGTLGLELCVRLYLFGITVSPRALLCGLGPVWSLLL
jgi:hypothetical protein